MNRLTKSELLNTVTSAIRESGWGYLYLSDDFPFDLEIYGRDERYRIRIYIWNITHGGGAARPQDEYRIQITSGVKQFIQPLNTKTLILGWYDELQVLAGWDYHLHSNPLGSSPSLQIHLSCLENASKSDFSACPKGNQEIAIAFRPELLVEYIRHLEALHSFGQSNPDLEILEAVAADPYGVNDADIDLASPERKQVVRTIQQKVRLSRFRSKVLQAYRYTCAFCGVQMNLVQAAHILPVATPESVDRIYNGIAACYQHHASYDQALITFDGQYQIHFNDERLEQLAAIQRDAGSEDFQAQLRQELILPKNLADRPHIEYVNRANQLRGWKL